MFGGENDDSNVFYDVIAWSDDLLPTMTPTTIPTSNPTSDPSFTPSSMPTAIPSSPSMSPTFAPTDIVWTISNAADSGNYSYYYYSYIVQDSQSIYPECIFLFGGDDCQKCVYCYNITSDELVNWDRLSTGTSSQGVPDAVMIGDTIYYLPYTGGISIYDVNTKIEAVLSGISTIDQESCLVRHPTNENYLFAVYSHSKTFYLIDLETGVTNTGFQMTGESLTFTRNWPSCAVNSFLDNVYLYVIGGDSVVIERINLDELIDEYESSNKTDISGTQWETLSGVLLSCSSDPRCTFDTSGYIRTVGVASVNQCIYIIGGETNDAAQQSNNQVLCLDVENEEILYLGDYLHYVEGHKVVSVDKRVYVFGGENRDKGVFYDTIAYSDELLPTSMPSSVPSFNPTTQPSNSPSNIPSAEPSYAPVTDPTAMPNVVHVSSTVGSEESTTKAIESTDDSNDNSNSGSTNTDSSGLTLDGNGVWIIVVLCVIGCCLCCVFLLMVLILGKLHNKSDTISQRQQLENVQSSSSVMNSANNFSNPSTTNQHTSQRGLISTSDPNETNSLGVELVKTLALDGDLMKPETVGRLVKGTSQELQPGIEGNEGGVAVPMNDGGYNNVNGNMNLPPRIPSVEAGGMVPKTTDGRNFEESSDEDGGGGVSSRGRGETDAIRNNKLAGWQNWSKKQVGDWLEYELLNNYGLNDESDKIKISNFIVHWRNNDISGRVLKLLKSKKEHNSNEWNSIKSQFPQNLQSIGLWLGVEDAIQSLP